MTQYLEVTPYNVRLEVDEQQRIVSLNGPVDSVPLDLLTVGSSMNNTSLRQVATNCRFPEIYATLRQILCESQHFAAQTIDSLMVEFCNFATNSELVKSSPLSVFTALQYPVGNGPIYIFGYHGGSSYGMIQPGGILRSDRLALPVKIPKGEKFSLWHHHSVPTTADGIPMAKGSPTVKFGNTCGRTLTANGSSYPQINYIMSKLPSFLTNLTSTLADAEDMIVPTSIIANPADDYDFNARAIIADSRSASATALPTDERLLNGLAERIFCGDGRGFINLACNSESFFNDFDTSQMYFQRRSHFLRYCDEIVNLLGTNNLSYYTDLATARAMELKLLDNPFIAGKKLITGTIPYKATSSSDYYTTTANQVMDANSSKADFLNEYRLTNPDGLYYEVKDIAALVSDRVAKKWKVGPNARKVTATVTAGSNVIDVPSGNLTPQNIVGGTAIILAGTGGAAQAGILQYVSPTQLQIFGRNKIGESTGVAVNAIISGNVDLYIDARHYSGDGIHDSIQAVLEEEAAYA